MTTLRDKPGRQIRLSVLIDREQNRVQFIRTLKDTKGFVVDSGNMGWMPLPEWQEFLAKQVPLAKADPTLMDLYAPAPVAEYYNTRYCTVCGVPFNSQDPHIEVCVHCNNHSPSPFLGAALARFAATPSVAKAGGS